MKMYREVKVGTGGGQRKSLRIFPVLNSKPVEVQLLSILCAMRYI